MGSNWLNINGEKLEELIGYAKTIYLKTFNQMNFFDLAKIIQNRFGDNIEYGLIQLIWNRLHEDIKISQLFGYDIDILIKKIDSEPLVSNKENIIEIEVQEVKSIINELDLFNKQYNHIINTREFPDDIGDDEDCFDYLLNKVDNVIVKKIIEFSKDHIACEYIEDNKAIEISRNDFKHYYEEIKKHKNTLRINKVEKTIFKFDFNKIREYASKLESKEAIIYYKYILKEFDREKRENNYLFMDDNEIEYFEKEIIRIKTIDEPADLGLMGIGAKKENAIKNFEINIKNEINFLEELSENELKKLETLSQIKIDQDLQIEKFNKLFKAKSLEKGKTIPNNVLYEISKEAGLNVPEKLKDFKTGNKAYQIAREYASRLEYKRKKRGFDN